MKLHDRFKQFAEDYLEFKEAKNPRSPRPDVHVLIMLAEMFPADRDLISAAEHDQYWLDVDCDEFNKLVTDDQLRDMIRAGLMHCNDTDSLSFFA